MVPVSLVGSYIYRLLCARNLLIVGFSVGDCHFRGNTMYFGVFQWDFRGESFTRQLLNQV
jgi:hypothetical protein